MTTLCLQLKDTDPYLNLATEEYLLKNQTCDIFMIWQSQSAIIVGKHQNALAEINHRYIRENNICIARRLSGGGTVFHDEGNLNFTFIKNVERVDQISYQLFTGQIINVLNKLGLKSYASRHNAIFLGDKKISGSADHVYKRRVLHHGTLLFNSHLVQLKNALKVDLSRFEDKAIQSNRSEVTNIADHLPKEMSIEEFAGFIFEQITQTYPDHLIAELTSQDREAIEKLKNEKYSQWDWIYGYSPKYKYRNDIHTSGKKVSFILSVEKGKIKEAAWEGDISGQLAALLTSALESQNHDYEVLKPVITALEPQLRQEGFSAREILEKIV
ncbi:MAG: lipoate--protein ligase [Mangrovibacterium sp.]